MFDDSVKNVMNNEHSYRSENIINRDLSTIIIDIYDYFKQPDDTLQYESMKHSDIRNVENAIYTHVNISEKYGIHLFLRNTMSYLTLGFHTVSFSPVPKSKIYEIDYDDLPPLENICIWKIGGFVNIFDDVKSDVDSDSDSDADIAVTVPKLDGRHKMLQDNGVDIKARRNDVCHMCYVPLYGEIYVFQKIINKKCWGLCDRCFKNSEYYDNDMALNKPHCVIWKTIYPRTLRRVLDDPDILNMMKIIPKIHDPVALINVLKLIIDADERIIRERYYQKLNDDTVLPIRIDLTGDRWQFIFVGKDYIIYMINSNAYKISDYELVNSTDDKKRYMILGGLDRDT